MWLGSIKRRSLPSGELIDKIAKSVGCGPASVNAMIARAERDPEFHKQQFTVLKADPQETILALIEVATADGEMSEAEKTVLRQISESLAISESTFEQLVEQTAGTEQGPRQA